MSTSPAFVCEAFTVCVVLDRDLTGLEDWKLCLERMRILDGSFVGGGDPFTAPDQDLVLAPVRAQAFEVQVLLDFDPMAPFASSGVLLLAVCGMGYDGPLSR
jgi:hypothetical protein